MLSLHTQDSVFSLRHAPSWLSLAASAGGTARESPFVYPIHVH